MEIKGRWFVDLLMIILIFWGLSFYIDFKPNTLEKKTAYICWAAIYWLCCFLAARGSTHTPTLGEEFFLKDENILLIFRFMPILFVFWLINSVIFKPYRRIITWANERLTINKE